jgi:hypothetical protein
MVCLCCIFLFTRNFEFGYCPDILIPVVTQYYVTEAENEYVIRGNSAVMKCKIPSFVADFVLVESWIADDGEIHSYSTSSSNYGNGH